MLKQNILDRTLSIFDYSLNVLGSDLKNKIKSRLGEQLVPINTINTGAGPIKLYSLGKIPYWRAKTLLTKEPETIAWIDSFKNNDVVLWDIGANIGTYSLYAGIKGVRTLAFEPFSGNYFLLNKNIELNNLDSVVSAFCVALGDKTTINNFYIADTCMGAALHMFGFEKDWRGDNLKTIFKQSMIGYTADDFINSFKVPTPNYIKLDVDGLEPEIINGMKTLLSGNQLISILVELSKENEDAVSRLLLSYGFKKSYSGNNAEVGNCIFWRA